MGDIIARGLAANIALRNKTKDFMKVESIAHRGAGSTFPENTLTAFSNAISYGFDSIEFDIHISIDGVPVIIHDTTVDRTTNGTGTVKNMTVAELQALDAGSKFSTMFAGEKIPTLEEVLKLASGRVEKNIVPEIKGYRTIDDISIMVDLIKRYGFEGNCMIQSFNWADFSIVRQLSKRITLAYLVQDVPAFNAAITAAVSDGNGVVFSDYNTVKGNPDLVSQAKSKGVDVVVWSVISNRDIKSIFEMGATRYITDYVRGVIS